PMAAPPAALGKSTEIEYDGSVEAENEPDEIAVQQIMRASIETFKRDQSDRDAKFARELAAQCGDDIATPPDKAYIEDCGSIERDL
ncbi:MAG: hypothetical protein SGPRY_004612, partial [Prymnesium sp.]